MLSSSMQIARGPCGTTICKIYIVTHGVYTWVLLSLFALGSLLGSFGNLTA